MICFSGKPRYASEYEAHMLRIYRLLCEQGYSYAVTQVDSACIRSGVSWFMLTLYEMLGVKHDAEITRRFFAEIEVNE